MLLQIDHEKLLQKLQRLVVSTEEKVECCPDHEQRALEASNVTEELHYGHNLSLLDLLLLWKHYQGLIDVVVFFIGNRRWRRVTSDCQELGELWVRE